MNRIRFCIGLLFICHLSMAQVDLSLRLKVGGTYTYSTTEKNTITQTIDGKDNTSINTMTGAYSYRIIEDRDSLYLMDVWFKELTQETESEEERSLHSSKTKDSPDVMCTILKKIVDRPFQVLMDKEFNWKEVTGLDSIFFNTYAGYNISPEKRKFLDSAIKDMMNEFISTSEMSAIAVYPSKTIKPNEIWTVNSVSENVIPTYDSCNYYLSEIIGDDVIIKSDGTVSSIEDENTNEGIITSYHLKGNISATTRFDKNTGWIRQAELKAEMKGYSYVREDGSGEKIKIPMQISRELFITGF